MKNHTAKCLDDHYLLLEITRPHHVEKYRKFSFAALGFIYCVRLNGWNKDYGGWSVVFTYTNSDKAENFYAQAYNTVCKIQEVK